MTLALRRRLAPALFAPLLLLAAAAPLMAQDTPDDPSELVFAKVNGKPVTQADVLELVETLPEAYRGQAAQIMPMLIERAIELEMMSQAAEGADLQDDPEVLERMARLKRNIMREVYITRAIDAAVTDEALQESYQAYLEANPPADEVRARHILVEEEEAAKEIIVELAEGGDFAELARSRSTGPSGPRGGDLGFFAKDAMVEPFAEAAFAMEPGTVSETPVQTQFGWHVIKVEERRKAPPPSFEELEEQLRADLSRDTVEGIVAELRETAEIEAVGVEPEEGAEPEGGAEAEGGTEGSDDAEGDGAEGDGEGAEDGSETAQ